MSEKPDYYKVLGVDKAATKDAIEKAFRRIAHKNNPDQLRAEGKTDQEIAAAEARVIEARAAKDVLTDDDKRRVYDEYGHAGLGNLPKGTNSSRPSQTYAEVAGPVREKKPLTEEGLIDFFDSRVPGPRKELTGPDGKPETPAQRRIRQQAERAARYGGGDAETTAAPPAPAPKPAAKPVEQPPAQETAPPALRETVQKVNEVAARVASGDTVEISVDALREFRDNLQDFMTAIDGAIARAEKAKKLKR